MAIPLLEDHTFTNNIYTKRQIVRNNISRLNQYRNTQEYITITHTLRKECVDILEFNIRVLDRLNDLIKGLEQITFDFNDIEFK